MTYRLYQDLAIAHITELEQEAQDVRLARLARRRATHVKSTRSNLAGLALHLVAQLRRHPGSHGVELRALTDLTLVSPQSEFDRVVERSNTLRFEENHFHDTGIVNVDLQLRLEEDESSSTKRRVALQSCCVIAL